MEEELKDDGNIGLFSGTSAQMQKFVLQKLNAQHNIVEEDASDIESDSSDD
jgi:hypothetical protein